MNDVNALTLLYSNFLYDAFSAMRNFEVKSLNSSECVIKKLFTLKQKNINYLISTASKHFCFLLQWLLFAQSFLQMILKYTNKFIFHSIFLKHDK